MIAIIGCGNPTRSDDGVGSIVLRFLAARGIVSRDGIIVRDAGTDGMAVMFAARGCRTLILIDACRSGSVPGTIFEVPGAELERDRGIPLATHGFRWDDALAAGRRLYGEYFPRDAAVFLIEAESVAFGIALSPPAIAAAARVADRIAQMVSARLAMAESVA